MHIHQYEKIFLWLTIGMLVIFLAAIANGVMSHGMHVASPVGRIADPAALDQTAPFDEPGLREVEPGVYEAVIVARKWSFTPKEIEIPAGSTLTMQISSPDIIHGVKVLDTNINIMVIPGQISQVSHQFDEPGEYLMICHEYCGLAHHAMEGLIRVTEPMAADGTVDGAEGSARGEG